MSVSSVPTVNAIGENWLTGWTFRRWISIDGTSGAGTDYQIVVDLPYDSDMQTDFDDIRFTDDDGDTLLDHWLENKTDSTEARFWVEVADSLDSTAWIYVYYGNATVSSASDGPATFPFFDDFNDGSINTTLWFNWFSGGSSTETAGVLTVAGGAGATETQGGKVKFGVDHAYEFNFSVDAEQDLWSMGADDRSADGIWEGSAKDSTEASYDSSQKWLSFDEGTSETTARVESCTSWQRMSIRRGDIIGINYVAYYLDEVLKDTDNTEVPLDDMGAWIYTRNTGSAVNVDFTFVRKYVFQGPGVDTIGNEEPDLWNDVGSVEFVFPVGWDPAAQFGYDMFFIVLGLIMIPVSTMYLVRGGRKEMSSDKLFFVLILFLVGIGLVIGGVMP